MKKKVLICGATGFIGRNMAEYFSSTGEYEVSATYHIKKGFENKNINWLQADLRNAEQVARVFKNQHIIINAAATTSGAKEIVTRPYLHVTDNAVMNSLMLREAFENKVDHFIFFSCTVMYPSGMGHPLTEEEFDFSNGISEPYFGVGWTKVYLEKICEFYSRLGSTKFTAVRHSNIYGPYDKIDLERSHVFGATIAKVLGCENGIVTVWGDGSEERDFLHVSDLVSYVKVCLNKQTENFVLHNVGCGEAISVKTLVEKIIKASGKNIKIIYDNTKPSFKNKLCIDSTKARGWGWRPLVTLEQGIAQTLEDAEPLLREMRHSLQKSI